MALVSVNVAYEGRGGNTSEAFRSLVNPARLEVIDTAAEKIVSITSLEPDDDSSALVITLTPNLNDPGKKVAYICEESYSDFMTNAGEAVGTYITSSNFATTFGAVATKKAATALVSGVKDFTDSNIRSTSVAHVQLVTRGGTFAARGYKVTMVDGVKLTVTALNGSDTAETGCTDTVSVIVFY